LASLSAQSEIAFITIHLSSILYSLATDNIEKASISQISAQKSTLSLEILSSLSTNSSPVTQTQFKINQNFCKS
jgi:hypothetical protein